MRRKQLDGLHPFFGEEENQQHLLPAIPAWLAYTLIAGGTVGTGYFALRSNQESRRADAAQDYGERQAEELKDVFEALPEEIRYSDTVGHNPTANTYKPDLLSKGVEQLQEELVGARNHANRYALLYEEVGPILAQLPETLEGQALRARVLLAINTLYVLPTEAQIKYAVGMAIQDDNKANAIATALEAEINDLRGDGDSRDALITSLGEIKVDNNALTAEEQSSIAAELAKFESVPTMLKVEETLNKIKTDGKFTVSSGGSSTEKTLTEADKTALTNIVNELKGKEVLTSQGIVNAINTHLGSNADLKAHVIMEISKISPLSLADAVSLVNFKAALEIVRNYIASGNTEGLRADLEAEINDPLLVAELVTSAELEIKDEVIPEIRQQDQSNEQPTTSPPVQPPVQPPDATAQPVIPNQF